MRFYELTSFWITDCERDLCAVRAWPCRTPGETSAGHGRKSPNTHVDQRGRANRRCVFEYLDVATLLRSRLNRHLFTEGNKENEGLAETD